jgi:peptidoglycan lytic transglycosylase G
VEGERPPRVRADYRRRRRGTRLGALLGVVVGFGLLAAIAWAVVGVGVGDGGSSAGEASTGLVDTAPPKPILRIVFPEGFTRKEMARRITAVNGIAFDERGIETSLRAKAYLEATENVKPRQLPAGFKNADPPNLEGFLFPATYDFTEDTTSPDLVADQLEAFGRAWSDVDMKYARSKNLTPYDVLIIASMVEKEVQVPRERAIVAGVIYNRLRAKMPLGIDATIRYGFDIPPDQAILQSQLDTDNPYNTRLRAGLPPTPISNPGLAALQAAAHPADVDYLYFVRKADCKSHFFTASLQKFNDYSRAGTRC